MLRICLLLLVLVAFSLQPSVNAQSTPEVHEQPTIAGTALDLIPRTGTELEVVAVGTLENGSIPYVVRNGTDKTVFDVVVKAEFRSAPGDLIAVAETAGGHYTKPTTLEPGDLGISYIFVDGEVPADAIVTYKTSSKDEGYDFHINLNITDAAWVTDHIVGEMVNPASTKATNLWMNLVCFDASGTPTLFVPNMLSEDIEPGGSTTFQFDAIWFSSATCETFLVAAHGMSAD